MMGHLIQQDEQNIFDYPTETIEIQFKTDNLTNAVKKGSLSYQNYIRD